MIPPINLPQWIETNKHLLSPPVNNYCLWRTDNFTIMAVGGPNKRTDYHVNPTEEFFYQHKGDMLLKLVLNSTSKTPQFVDQPIKEGEMFLLPANTPHNPIRFADTVGVVIEVPRPEGHLGKAGRVANARYAGATDLDSLRWYCEKCEAVVYQESFYCTDLGVQLKPVIEAWAQDAQRRVCKGCGHHNPTK
ncbi:3-hydroxyanthranilic acid dioxygenase [Kappamyces sp. JEL0829]|nr:3-hydroxyanthranilic acid dioxygenase [Kappamyces sp. JEL0829]